MSKLWHTPCTLNLGGVACMGSGPDRSRGAELMHLAVKPLQRSEQH